MLKLENLKKIEVYQKAVDQAKENYRITKNKYDNALATTTDLLDAENAFTEAENNYTNALLEYKLAEIELIKAQGALKSLTKSLIGSNPINGNIP